MYVVLEICIITSTSVLLNVCYVLAQYCILWKRGRHRRHNFRVIYLSPIPDVITPVATSYLAHLNEMQPSQILQLLVHVSLTVGSTLLHKATTRCLIRR